MRKGLIDSEGEELGRLVKKHGLQRNSTKLIETITLGRVAMTFAPLTVVADSDPEVPLIKPLDITVENTGEKLTFLLPKASRSTAVLSLLRPHHSKAFRRAFTYSNIERPIVLWNLYMI